MVKIRSQVQVQMFWNIMYTKTYLEIHENIKAPTVIQKSLFLL